MDPTRQSTTMARERTTGTDLDYGGESDSRKLLGRLRTALAEDSEGQERLDRVTSIIADAMGVEVCSIYLFRDAETLELCATEGLRPEAVHKTRMRIGSPAEDLVRNTVYFMDPDLFIPVLALWESLIGLGLITGKYMRLTLLLLFLQMPGTALPLIILPEKVWTIFPYGLTLEGQYIIKNLVLISAGLVLGATVRGGKMILEDKK